MVADHYAGDAVAQQILDAARHQFAMFGLRRSTIDDVAKRAGLSRITVYRRFSTKNNLIEACLTRECRFLLRELDQALGELPTMEDRVVEGFVVSMQYARGHPLIGGLLRVEPEVVLPFLTVNGGPALVALREYIAGHLRRGQSAPDDADREPEPVAELMVRIAVSFLLNPESCVEIDDAEQCRAFARRYLAPLIGY
ncbi:TetR/AcrR family transcriptional regulator [Halostreptopolyspora alba]|uniref:TetR/AcrR family transcriptional regulator n=2 Tax=Halostreptopolyspora alba TaxID=2487137 RepID=A0A3N0E306_9ACTN|nr:TetR/AcrR family transcriptional regulator [Nocardiopsaceae bacterium YIM 96095]